MPDTEPVSNGRASTRKKATKSYVEPDEDEDLEEEVPIKTRGRPSKNKQASLKEEEDFAPEHEDVDMEDANPEDDFLVPDDDEELVEDKPVNNRKIAITKAGKKRKSRDLEDDEDEMDEPPKKASTKAKTKDSSSKPPAKKTKAPAKKVDKIESKAMQDIYDSIPTVRPPTPPSPSGETKKFNFANRPSRDAAAGSGSREPPQGAENCLAGLTFVFTGILDSLGREEGAQLVKRYGGKVTTAPSAKTSYVVLGSDAGPKKLETIQKYGLKTINEDGLWALIERLPANGGDGKAAEKQAEKRKADEEKVKQQAAEIEKEERRLGGSGGAGLGSKSQDNASSQSNGNKIDNRLWTVKYAPTNTNMICGNGTQVMKLQTWLRNWSKNVRTNFKMAGKDGSGVFRSVMIHGPPGIGKTTAAHLVAKLEGYDIVESNASDTRSKKLVEAGLKGVLDTTSLMGYFAGDKQNVDPANRKLVLIMDEVDGMSAGDRGGVGALAAAAKKTKIPIIMICNDRRLPKMKPFDHVCYELPFRKPTTEQVRSRMMTIAFRENIKMPAPVMDAIIEGSRADIRQVINMISTIKTDNKKLDFDGSKQMSKAWEKHVILKPWDIVGKILQGHMFAQSSKSTLNEKIELYFNDHEFSSLMLQENYLKTSPQLANNYSGQQRSLKTLELVDKAAESISDGDLIDRVIHGSQQQWSLMPTHAVFSFVRPASFVSGTMAGHGGTSFTSWLGNNSKQG